MHQRDIASSCTVQMSQHRLAAVCDSSPPSSDKRRAAADRCLAAAVWVGAGRDSICRDAEPGVPSMCHTHGEVRPVYWATSQSIAGPCSAAGLHVSWGTHWSVMHSNAVGETGGLGAVSDICAGTDQTVYSGGLRAGHSGHSSKGNPKLRSSSKINKR